MRPFHLVLILCLLLISACGGGDQATASPTMTMTAPPPPPATPPPTQPPATDTPAPTPTPSLPSATPTSQAPTETPAITWAQVYTGDPRVAVLDALRAEDGGYLLVGASNYSHRDTFKEDVLLMKTDTAGEVLWIKTYGGEAFDRGKAIIPAADGGYVILAETKSYGAGDYDILVIKVDAGGQELWSRVFGGPERELASAIQATADGGYIVVGSTASYGSGPEDLFLIKLGPEGQELWSQFYGGEYMEEGYAVHQTADGGFFVLGELLHREGFYPDQEPDIYLLKTDNSGQEIWSQVLEEAGAQGGHALMPTSDGGYIIAGILIPEGEPDQADVLLLKVDDQGTLLWDQSISDASIFDYVIDITETSEGDYVLSGMSDHNGQGGILLIKIDPEGNPLWQRTLLEERGNKAGMQVLEAANGGYVIAGTTGQSVQAFDAMLVQTDQDGNLASPSPSEIEVAPPPPTAITIAESTPPTSPPLLAKSPQSFPPAPTFQIALGDLDADGDLDAVFATMGDHNSQVWLNDGDGLFEDSGQELTQQGHGVGLGDLDGDGDLDLFITCATYSGRTAPSQVYLNDGTGTFSATGQDLGDTELSGTSVNLVDIDSDGDLDACVMYYEQPYKVYLNDGLGTFTESELSFSSETILTWGDLDGDGDSDLFLQEREQGYKVMLNDGAGNLTEHWQTDDPEVTWGGAALGDLDGDGDLDAVITNGDHDVSYPSVVMFNDGTGRFADRGQRLAATKWGEVSLGDLDADGDLDAVITNFEQPNQVWFNDGQGVMHDSGLRLSEDEPHRMTALGDLDADGDLDIFLANFGFGQHANEIWLNSLSTQATEPPGLSLDVPQGNPISLDGTLSPDEWASARQVELSNGGELLLMHDQGYLYLGIRAPANPLGSICLDRGEQIAVLHSSAALGTAVYQPGEDRWQRTQDFSWSCRATSNSPQAQRERDEHLQAEGWVASNGRMGASEELEYQIAMPDGSLRLAVAYLQAPNYRSVSSWPEQLDDGCATLELLTGPVPDNLPFAPETWMTLKASTANSDLAPTGPNSDLRLTIVYDNTAYDQRLTAEWGFAAWIEYGDHTLLFDTGGNGITLLDNIDKLGLDPQEIEVVVLSHEHGDHTDGLTSLLRRANRPTVYVPTSFSTNFKRSTGALTDLIEVTEPVEIWPGVHTTGEVHGGVTEQGLVIETEQGIVLITGCAHPGVVNMVRRARRVVDDEVALVVGGFHLGRASRVQVERIIDQLGELDVKQVCPTHCTGEASIAIFAEAYGDDYVQGGVGQIINIPGGKE